MKQATKSNRTKSFANHKGRFVSLSTKTRDNGNRNFCAKILNESPCYVTFYDINSKKVVKVNKNSIV
jgi:ribosome maturation factor RimP